jgi:hypothetical protein
VGIVTLLISAVYGDNACTNANDAKIMKDSENVYKMGTACGLKCAINPNTNTCIASCMAGVAKLSSACSACFGVDAVCTKKNCMTSCVNPLSTQCRKCSVSKCGAAMAKCTGFPVSALVEEIADAGACMDANDLSKMSNENALIQTASQCGMGCIYSNDFGSCVSSCAQTNMGLTYGCATCFGSGATCMMNNCLFACMKPSSAECMSCASNKCGPGLASCSGLPIFVNAKLPSSPKRMIALDTGRCLSADDTSKMADQSHVEDVGQQCGVKCITNVDFSGCVASCAIQQLGVSPSCSTCFSDDASCTMKNCMLKCVNPASPGCKQCSMAKCGPGMAVCTGIPLKPNANAVEGSSGACMNMLDLNKLKNLNSLIQSASQCGMGCIYSNDFGTCAQNCAQTSLGLTPQCSACFGNGATCMMNNCLFSCMKPNSPQCIQCAKNTCAAGLAACSGLPL